MSAELEAILETLGPAQRFANPSASIDARLMAAGGALPLPPPQIATVLYLLTQDEDAGVKDKATRSLEGLPAPVIDGALSGPLHPAPLAYFAEKFCDSESRVEKIALNAATSDETFCFLAGLPFPRIIDIVANNQVRLMRCPALVEALGENSLASQATIDRVLQFLGIERGENEIAPPQSGDIPEPPPPVDVSTGTAIDLEDPSDLPPELSEENASEEELSESEAEELSQSLLSRVAEMNVMEKVKLARFSNGEARAILIRDRNKIVATAAIRSPKIQESEVSSFAKSRNISEDVLRIIANNREWTRVYDIKLSLTTNPKAPQATAIKFLNYLTDRDLMTVMRSKELPGPISQQARRILSRKGKI
ncbi:MAG: hypothetical protein GY725_22855 [bacterium]|nr:hypothetical protein [bacterium]